MRDSIYTIPVSEVFEPMDGCPVCRLRDTLEKRCIEYIMGAAMMEPDIREETNKAGFCASHFDMMLHSRNRLSIALMLESHLDYIKKDIFEQKQSALKQALFKKPDSRVERAKAMTKTCYVCDKIQWALSRMVDTTIGLWKRNPPSASSTPNSRCSAWSIIPFWRNGPSPKCPPNPCRSFWRPPPPSPKIIWTA